MRRVAAIAAALALVACSARTEIAGPSPTGSASPTATGSPRRAPRVPAAAKVVYVVGEALYVYDVRTDRATEIARGEGVRQPRFVDANVVSFLQGDRTAYLRTMDLRSREIRDVFSVRTGITAYGWSPGRDIVAYVTVDDLSYPHVHLRTVAGTGATLTATTLARAFGREFVNDDQVRVEFSPDGELVLIVYTPADGEGEKVSDDASQLQVRALDGSLVHASPMRREPTMGLWAPNGKRVYYRTGAGALYWDRSNGRTAALFSRPRWYDPWISRDGRKMAFASRGMHPGSRIRLMDLRRGTIQTIFERGRFRPVIASKNVVWAQEVQPCEGCPGGFEPANAVYAWDLRKGKERKLGIESLVDADVLYR